MTDYQLTSCRQKSMGTLQIASVWVLISSLSGAERQPRYPATKCSSAFVPIVGIKNGSHNLAASVSGCFPTMQRIIILVLVIGSCLAAPAPHVQGESVTETIKSTATTERRVDNLHKRSEPAKEVVDSHSHGDITAASAITQPVHGQWWSPSSTTASSIGKPMHALPTVEDAAQHKDGGEHTVPTGAKANDEHKKPLQLKQ